ncbi:uncharacterized protein TRIADDRAFT_26681 [Trichoplax adhaerens]|uniref:Cleavage stimulation factor 50 kDa subunit n=1 Tax=Trichoplax adhaerens TaxID=10228 RepID=B3RZT4_TRIAD|nr:hypothetical protein TRIADDRAFT_26681 [Trichoplax adhaerens]EDV23894.1 hypothetical protein TRIADDRAFT_26681 [Trichoplax adhaerens]|eukprot:XP_002113420.1 hypothetical protein TRIADDRAFT_26681 [Trichoplax adhaerens]
MSEIVKNREQLYKLIISQLRYDGYEDIAALVGNTVNTLETCAPSSKLFNIVSRSLSSESQGRLANVGEGIDLEYEGDVIVNSPPVFMYETCYVTAHKAPCRVACFTKDDRLVATGSVDNSIKILDVDRMIAKGISDIPLNEPQPQSGQQMESHPVIRTLYDHSEAVTALEFHPKMPILASGSRDRTVKLFDFSKPSIKRAFKSIQDAYGIRSISFHPTGDYLLVGSEHSTVRLYDVNTTQCFVSSNPHDHHVGPITMVSYAPNAKLYATSSKDGSVKIWDGVSCRCIITFGKAHNGAEVSSVTFTRNSKYILTSGKDSTAKLWELATGNCMNIYAGATQHHHRTQAVFNQSEDYVLLPDEKHNSVYSWDARTGEKQKNLTTGHNNIIRCIYHASSIPAMVTCSDDFRARFWYTKGMADFKM